MKTVSSVYGYDFFPFILDMKCIKFNYFFLSESLNARIVVLCSEHEEYRETVDLTS